MKITKLIIVLIAINVINSCWVNATASIFDNDPVEIIHVKVNEISDNEGVVSTENKKFRLIVDHNANYIAAQDKNIFNANSSPILRNLIILKRDLNRTKNNAKNITEEFEFEQESDSFNSPEYDGLLRTTFISNNQIIKKAQRLSFKINLENYLRSLGVPLFSNLDVSDVFKLDIEALQIEFTSLSLEDKSLVFNAANPERIKSIYNTDNLNLIGTFISTNNLSDVIKQLSFETQGANGKPIAIKLKQDGTKLKDIRLKADADDESISFNTNGNGLYTMSLPISFSTKEKLNSMQISIISNYDLLIVPVVLDLKTGDNLDINISGTLRETVNISNGGIL